MNELERTLGNGSCFLHVLKMVHPDKDIRNASKEAVSAVSKIAIELKCDQNSLKFLHN